MEASLRRPKPGEDDLEEMMAEFERSRSQAAVTAPNIVNKRKSEGGNGGGGGGAGEQKKPKSKFSASRARPPAAAGHSMSGGQQEPAAADQVKLLGGIVEKNLSSRVPVPPSLNKGHNQPFPEVLKVEHRGGGGGGNSKRSIFAQNFQEMKRGIGKEADNCTDTFGNRSYILQGTGLQKLSDVEEIHKENLDKLNAMSEEDLEKSQSDLIQSLSPSLIEFLRSKRLVNKSENVEVLENVTPVKQAADSQQFGNEEKKDEEPGSPDETMLGSHETMLASSLQQFPHMETNEPEKHQWMADVVTASAGAPLIGLSARFDFNGRLVADAESVDTHAGLHHHGEEPHRPGYTFEELLTLARSTFSQQKVLALDTLTNIVRNIQNGLLDGCFQENPVAELINVGFLQLLRASMDEKEESVIFSAVRCLSALFYNSPDEVCLDSVHSWEVVQPRLAGEKIDQEAEELTDLKLAQIDPVLALIRMDVLERLTYIFSTLSPGLATVECCLKLLCRIARHSLQVADSLSKSKGLISAIFANHLPAAFPSVDSVSKEGGRFPKWIALKLLRILCSWGRHITLNLCSLGLVEILLLYVNVDPTQMNLPVQDAVKLSLETYRTWKVLLTYGIACENFTSMFPVLMKQLLYYVENVNVGSFADCMKYTLESGAEFFGMLEAVVAFAGSSQGMQTSPKWDEVAGLLDPAETCLKKWLSQLSSANMAALHTSVYSLVAACQSFCATYYQKLESQPSFQPVSFLDRLKQLFEKFYNVYLTSSCFASLLTNLAGSSLYLSQRQTFNKRFPPTLPSLNVVVYGGELVPVMSSNSAVVLVKSTIKFVSTCITINKQLSVSLDAVGDGLLAYINSMCTSSLDLSLINSWFARQEAELLYWLLKLHTQRPILRSTQVHRLSLMAVGLLQPGHELYLKDLLNRVVFCKDYIDTDGEINGLLELMSLADNTALKSPASQAIPKTESVLEEMFQNLDSLLLTYEQKLIFGKTKEFSTALNLKLPARLHTLTLRNAGETILPSDWTYLPLLDLYQKVSDGEQSGKGGSVTSSPSDIASVQHCLAWLNITSDISLNTRNLAACYVRLSTVFLSGSDIFLDPVVHSLLGQAVKLLLTCTGPDLGQAVPGLSSVHELYLQLIGQFEAVSYGDQLFSLFLVLGLTTRQPLAFRKSLWTEHPEAVRLISLTPDNLRPLALSNFFEPAEKEGTVLVSMFRSLMEKRVSKERNPLMFKIAAHHVSSVLKGGDANLANLKNLFSTELQNSDNEELKRLL